MATQAEFDEWKREDEDNKEEMESRLENIKNISIGKKETKPKQKHKDEGLENKHQDLFDELFGDKS